MKVNKFCPDCLERQEFVEVSYDEDFHIKQETITVNSSYLKCTECSNEILIPGKEDDNIQEAYTIYRQRKNLLTPEEIKNIRESYNLSQRTLAKILGWSHATLSRYETGALQSVSHNNELILIKEPSNMLILLNINKENVSASEYDEISKNIYAILYKNDISLKFSKETYDQLYSLANDNLVDIETLVKEYVVKGVQNSIDASSIISYLEKSFRSKIMISFNSDNKEARKIVTQRKGVGGFWKNTKSPAKDIHWKGVPSIE